MSKKPRNFVAKHSKTYNKATVMVDRSKQPSDEREEIEQGLDEVDKLEQSDDGGKEEGDNSTK